jgi:hypothetical protein
MTIVQYLISALIAALLLGRPGPAQAIQLPDLPAWHIAVE